MSASPAGELPPLPEPEVGLGSHRWAYSDSQMQNYARTYAASLAAKLAEAKAECATLRADAERWRYVREACVQEDDDGTLSIIFVCDFENYNDVDASVDAARRGET